MIVLFYLFDCLQHLNEKRSVKYNDLFVLGIQNYGKFEITFELKISITVSSAKGYFSLEKISIQSFQYHTFK